jgi:hypothetical protein
MRGYAAVLNINASRSKSVFASLGYSKRTPGLTNDQFSTHWGNVNGPLSRAVPNVYRYLTRYVQHHLTRTTVFPVPAAMEFDGFSEVWLTIHEANDELFRHAFFKSNVIADDAFFQHDRLSRVSDG